MKKTWFSVFAVIVIFFVSCYEIHEDIVLNKRGSGTYITRMDMSALIQMIQTVAGEEEIAKSGFDRPIDTTIFLKEVMDSVKDLTSDQRRLFSEGTMKLQMDIKQNVLKADMKFPFKNYEDLQNLMSGAGTGGMAEVFKKVMAGKDTSHTPVPAKSDGLDQIISAFDVTVTKNSIIRKLNREKYDSLMAKPEIAQAKQMMGNGFEILYTTTIRLPRRVKKSDNPLVKLSSDKKTVTIKYDLMKIFDTPEQFSYSIQY